MVDSLLVPHRSLWARALLLLLALAVGMEHFRSGVTLRLTHSHAYDASGVHGHVDIFEGLAEGVEVPLFPSETDPTEHTHVIRDFPDQSSQQIATSRIVVVPAMENRCWTVIESIVGPSRPGDSLFRPPC